MPDPKPMDSFFEVLPAGEMRRKYGFTAENRPLIKLEPSKVPDSLRHLIPLAEEFGIGDDLIRADVLAKTQTSNLAELRRQVEINQDALDAWLAGPESYGPDWSPEYLAFSCMRMAADGC